jgi:phosphate transport system substrate-binding protein
MKAQNGSLGVAGYVSQSYAEGAITYVENSYALNSGLPVTKVLNAGGYYVAPTSGAVSIALLGAGIDTEPSSPGRGTLRLAGVYTNPDPRAYPLSSATYMIVPTQPTTIFTAEKGATLSGFTQYALCAGQRRAVDVGDASLPLNLVQAAFSELVGVPATPSTLDSCDNPTFVAGDTVGDSLLTRTAPMPPESDRADGVGGDSCAPTGGAGEIGLCATTIAAVDEPLSLELPAEAAAAFEEPRLMNGRSLTVGALPEITVTDGRVVSHPGWDLLATVADFRNAADETIVISSVDTGLRPVVVGGDGVTAGAGEVAGSAVYPTVFASAETGSGVGDTILGGEVSLLSPPDRPAGTYRSSMTLTLVSR